MSITDEEVRARLEQCVSQFAERTGTRRAWSDARGIDPNYTNQVLRGVRRASSNILSALGLRRTETEWIESITEDRMRRKGQELLEARIEDMLVKHGNQANWAAHLGVSRAYVSKVVNGDKPPNAAMLREMGLVLIREERIEKITPEENSNLGGYQAPEYARGAVVRLGLALDEDYPLPGAR